MTDISVVITSFNRREALLLSLASFSLQTFPTERFEVIVVDDGSTDGSVASLQSHSWPFNLQIVRTEQNSGVSHARNAGIHQAQGNIVVFSDSDMIVPADYVELHWMAHQGKPNSVVSAPYRNNVYTQIYPDHLNTKLWNRMVQRVPELANKIPPSFQENSPPIQLFQMEDVLDETIQTLCLNKQNKTSKEFVRLFGSDLTDCPMPWLAYAGSNSSVPRKSLLDIAGFDPQLRYRHDDRDIGYRLYKTGHRFQLHDGIIGIHQDHFREQDREKMDIYSFHDLAIMIRKHPERDMYLFGLYQSDKKRFKPPSLALLKKEMEQIEEMGNSGRSVVRHMEHLLINHVWYTIQSYVDLTPESLTVQPPRLKPSYYLSWVETQKKNKNQNLFPLFMEAVTYLAQSYENWHERLPLFPKGASANSSH